MFYSLLFLGFFLISVQGQGQNATCFDTAWDCANSCKMGLCFNYAYVQTMYNRCQQACGWCGRTLDEVRDSVPRGKRAAGFAVLESILNKL